MPLAIIDVDKILALYQDGVRITAFRGSFGDVGYAIQIKREMPNSEVFLDEREARELAAALTWVISEADRKAGKSSFRPPAKRSTGKVGA